MSGAASIRIEVTDSARLQKALRILAEEDAPFLREALTESGRDLTRAVASRAPGRMAGATTFAGVTGKAHGLKATTLVKHPGAKSKEFGRQFYYRDFEGRRQKATGRRFRSRGQKPEPFIGIVHGGHAIGAVEPKIRERLADAVHREWDRVGGA